jgi:hypothetical protein
MAKMPKRKVKNGEELIAGRQLNHVPRFLCWEAEVSEHKEPKEQWLDRFRLASGVGETRH